MTGLQLRRWLGTVVLCVASPLALRAAPDATFYRARVQPILDQYCVSCHGLEKKRGGFQVHAFEALMRGGDSGAAIAAGAPEQSELLRRLTLVEDDDEAMPPAGKSRVAPEKIEIIRRWVQAGAAEGAGLDAVDIAGLDTDPVPMPAATLDYRPHARQLAELERALDVRFVPVSENPRDGLILRTVSHADRIDDRVLARLAPVASLIVDAELARTRVTDAGLAVVGQMTNLRRLDLAHTPVTSHGVAQLGGLERLEVITLVGTAVDAAAWETLRRLTRLQRVHTYRTAMGESAPNRQAQR